MKRSARALWGVLLLLPCLAERAKAQLGEAYCFGLGCPCANDDPSAGCGNRGVDEIASSGALLEAVAGTADVLRDDLVLAVRGVRPGQVGIVYLGGGATSAPFGDGLRCVTAGGAGLHRLPPRAADATGTYAAQGIVRALAGLPGGGIVAGSTWRFQGWYRDPGGPCGSGFNLTNALSIQFGTSAGPVRVELAGRPLSAYPHFERVQTFFQGTAVHMAVDPALLWQAAGAQADVYVVRARSSIEWAQDPLLVDARGAPDTRTFGGADVAANTFLLDAGSLGGTEGSAIGVGYDVVIDLDRDGLLGLSDLIDGYGGAPGFSVLRDTSAPGPHAVTEVTHNAGTFLTQRIYFPADIAALAQLPLIVVSHGNGHQYTWYDHIGRHMASYGYVVMSHRNNTMPGSDAASITTLDNTDHLIGNQATIAGGVLDGHIDARRIVWIGHSRGGEGVVRAYDRLFDGTNSPAHFSIDDVRLVSSIAPTNFLGPTSANPHGVDYHLWVGSADADVDGGASSSIAQSYQLYERATGRRAAITLQGAGHAVFHNGGGSNVASGPCQLSPATTHRIMKGYLLALVRFHLEGEGAAEESLWRPYDSFRPPGAPPTSDPCVVVHLEYEEGPNPYDFFADTYQAGPGLEVSSAHGPVEFAGALPEEGALDDNNSSLTWLDSDPFNGMTRGSPGDFTRGLVLGWTEAAHYEIGLVPMHRNLSAHAYLCFRACQATRHPSTVAELGDLFFRVVLRDGAGTESAVQLSAFGGGVGEPYQRTGQGTGVGWSNEFETFRIPLDSFLAGGSGLRLWDVHALRLEFGGSAGSAFGRIGLDDLAFRLR